MNSIQSKPPHLTQRGHKLEKRAQRIAWLCSLAPFVRMIGLTGSVARMQASEKSDIDFFVFSSSKRMWTCRFFVTLFVSLTGKRRYGKKVAGRICLNRYQTISNMEVLPHNKYNAWDYSYLTPLISSNNYYYSYMESNKWISEFDQSFQANKNIKPKNGSFTKFFQSVFEFLVKGRVGDKLEELLRNYQIKKIKNNPLYSKSNPNIIVGDNVFCSHIDQKAVEPKP